MQKIGAALKERGLFTYTMASAMGTMIFVIPPLMINKGQLDEGLGIIRDVLDNVTLS
jgi:adenosylmethionine-8-amino-7-oxononanoate aminotransferase